MSKSEKSKFSQLFQPKYLMSFFVTVGILLAMALLCAIFLSENIPLGVTIAFGVVFTAIFLFIMFYYGKMRGEKDYKEALVKFGGNSGSYKTVRINFAYSFLYNVLFVVVFTVLLLIAVLKNSTILHGSMFVLFMPISLIFATVLSSLPVTWVSFAVYFSYIVLTCIAFIAGYVIKVIRMRKVQRDIASEIRMFNS